MVLDGEAAYVDGGISGSAFSVRSASFVISVLSIAICLMQCSCQRGVGYRLYETYTQGLAKQRAGAIRALGDLGEDGIPYLRKISSKAKKRHCSSRVHNGSWRREYIAVLDAIARIGTERAAETLATEVRNSDPFGADLPARALAGLGSVALKHLVAISADREFGLSYSPDDLPIHPHFRASSRASKAREAIGWVDDPKAISDLGRLLDNSWTGIPAFKALAKMKAVGYEDVAELWWRKKIHCDEKACALGYLLAVNRKQYLPLLTDRLVAFDEEVARLQRDRPRLLASKAATRIGFDERALIWIIYEMGGDPVTVGPVGRFLESKIWIRPDYPLGDEIVVVAARVLGISRSRQAIPVLLRLLQDGTLVRQMYSSRFRHSYSERKDKDGNRAVPVCVLAAHALADLGDPSVIAAVEKARTKNPDLTRSFNAVISTLQMRREAQRGAPADPAKRGR